MSAVAGEHFSPAPLLPDEHIFSNTFLSKISLFSGSIMTLSSLSDLPYSLLLHRLLSSPDYISKQKSVYMEKNYHFHHIHRQQTGFFVVVVWCLVLRESL